MGGGLTPIVKNLLLLNIGFFLIAMFVSPKVTEFLALYDFHSQHFKPYQFLSYMFMHSTRGLGHIFGNMLALYVFGPHLERLWGSNKFLTFYVVTGVFAGLFYGGVQYYQLEELKTEISVLYEDVNPSRFHQYGEEYLSRSAEGVDFYNYEVAPNLQKLAEDPENVEYRTTYNTQVGQLFQFIAEQHRMVGASGAVFGLLLAFAMYFPNVQLMLLFPPIPIKAKYLVMFYGAYEIYAEFKQAPGDNVAHLAHLAGMLMGFLLILYWRKKGDSYRGF